MKCKIINTNYRIENKTVVCTIIFNIVSKNINIIKNNLKTAGFSVCRDTDKFDPKTGMRIALAKAERKMYKTAYKMISRDLNRITKIEKEMTDFLPFAKEQIDHDTKHILSICDGTFKERKK